MSDYLTLPFPIRKIYVILYLYNFFISFNFIKYILCTHLLKGYPTFPLLCATLSKGELSGFPHETLKREYK